MGLAGFGVRYGPKTAALIHTGRRQLPASTSTLIDGLTAGTWYFTVSAFTALGVESLRRRR